MHRVKCVMDMRKTNCKNIVLLYIIIFVFS